MQIYKNGIFKLLNIINKPRTMVDPEFERIHDLPGFLSENAFKLFQSLEKILSQNKRLRRLKVLEIGVYCGRSLVGLGLIFKQTKIIGVDPFYESFYDSPAFPKEAEYLASHAHNSDARSRLRRLAGKIEELDLSRNIEIDRKTQNDFLKSANREKYQLIYVDGEHSFYAINQFLNLMSAFLPQGGFLVFDDVLSAGYPGISEAIHRHNAYKKEFHPICYAFNKGVFIYKPTKVNFAGALEEIKKFATTNNYVFRKSENDNSLIIFE